MVLRGLSSVDHFSTTFPVGCESLSALKILRNVLTARRQVLSAASFRILVHSMAPPESAAVFLLRSCQGRSKELKGSGMLLGLCANMGSGLFTRSSPTFLSIDISV